MSGGRVLGFGPGELARADAAAVAVWLDEALDQAVERRLLPFSELLSALLEGRVDLALAELRDLPPVLPPGLALAWVSPRADAREAWVCPRGTLPEDLPIGSRVGYGTARSAAMLRRLNRGWRPFHLDGDAEERLQAVNRGDCDAAVLAAADLERLGRLAAVTHFFGLPAYLPAPGQGFHGLLAREGETLLRDLLKREESPADRACAGAERGFWAALAGAAPVPVGAWAVAEDDAVLLHGWVGDLEGARHIQGHASGWMEEAESVGRRLAARLRAPGGL